MVASISIRNGFTAIALIEDGVVEDKLVYSNKDDNMYLGIIHGFEAALRRIRGYCDRHGWGSRSVTFEVGNNAFIDWVNRQYAKDAYQDEFDRAMRLLQELPIRYDFIYSKAPRALQFADAAHMEKRTLTALDIV